MTGTEGDPNPLLPAAGQSDHGSPVSDHNQITLGNHNDHRRKMEKGARRKGRRAADGANSHRSRSEVAQSRNAMARHHSERLISPYMGPADSLPPTSSRVAQSREQRPDRKGNRNAAESETRASPPKLREVPGSDHEHAASQQEAGAPKVCGKDSEEKGQCCPGPSVAELEERIHRLREKDHAKRLEERQQLKAMEKNKVLFARKAQEVRGALLGEEAGPGDEGNYPHGAPTDSFDAQMAQVKSRPSNQDPSPSIPAYRRLDVEYVTQNVTSNKSSRIAKPTADLVHAIKKQKRVMRRQQILQKQEIEIREKREREEAKKKAAEDLEKQVEDRRDEKRRQRMKREEEGKVKMEEALKKKAEEKRTEEHVEMSEERSKERTEENVRRIVELRKKRKEEKQRKVAEKAARIAKAIEKKKRKTRVVRQARELAKANSTNVVSIDQKQQGGSGDVGPEAEPKGVMYIGHIPHGFYEEEMKGYFSQFGDVQRLRISRSRDTAKSRGYGFLEFEDEEVAKVAAEAMDGYLMHGRKLVTKFVPKEDVNPQMFRNWQKSFRKIHWSSLARTRMVQNATDPLKVVKRSRGFANRLRLKQERITKMGIEYNLPEVIEDVTAMTT